MNISPRIKWIAENISGSVILDIGFIGESQPLVHQIIRQARPDALLIGVDNNLDSMRRYNLAGSIAGDGLWLPFSKGSFDTVTLFEVIEHFDKEAVRLIEESRRVLRQGGKFYLTTPNPYSWTRWARSWLLPRDICSPENYRRFLGHPGHRMFWEPLSLISTLSNHGLRVVHLTTKNHRIPLLARLIRRLGVVDLPIYPFSRLGGYTCLIAVAE